MEALARSGVGALDLIDNDKVCLTNLNRQIIALHSTLGRDKVDVMRERVLDINPECKVTVHKCFYLPETEAQFDFTQYDYVVDAVTLTAKLALVVQAKKANTPVISSMGAGNKLKSRSISGSGYLPHLGRPAGTRDAQGIKKTRNKGFKGRLF